jgi:transcriptional regulator with XRE-family HTH domain
MLRMQTMSSQGHTAETRALGRRIKAARDQAGLQQAELARRCEVIPTTVWRWEVGRAEPSLSMLRTIARETGTDLGWLAGGVAA